MIKEMPNIALGTWTISDSKIIRDIVTTALTNGYKHIDTAQAYSNEGAIGDALQKLNMQREDYWITSKIHPINYKFHTMHSIKTSLKKLKIKYLDAMLLHAPDDRKLNEIAYKELMIARDQGLTRTIGVSNFGIEDLKELKEDVGEYPEYNQIASSVKVRTIELETFCKENNIKLMGYSSIRPYFNSREHSLNENERKIVDQLAAKYNVGPAIILLAFVSQNGYVILPQSTKPKRVIENFSVTKVKLSNEELKMLNMMVEYKDEQLIKDAGDRFGEKFKPQNYKEGFELLD